MNSCSSAAFYTRIFITGVVCVGICLLFLQVSACWIDLLRLQSPCLTSRWGHVQSLLLHLHPALIYFFLQSKTWMNLIKLYGFLVTKHPWKRNTLSLFCFSFTVLSLKVKKLWCVQWTDDVFSPELEEYFLFHSVNLNVVCYSLPSRGAPGVYLICPAWER